MMKMMMCNTGDNHSLTTMKQKLTVELATPSPTTDIYPYDLTDPPPAKEVGKGGGLSYPYIIIQVNGEEGSDADGQNTKLTQHI